MTQNKNEQNLAHEFYEEIKSRNKAKFIHLATKNIEKEQAEQGGVNIPAFLEAENAYKEFQKADAFDCYGYLKQI